MIQSTQTAQILPLAFGLLGPEEAKAVAARLAELLEERDFHLTTGFLGTPYLCQALTDHSCGDVAYKLLQRDFPSWLYQVTMGAITIWEHWDGIKPDGSFWSADMNSFNHYAYGSIGEWLYRCAAGIEIDEEAPGYRHILIRPHPHAALGHVRCAYESVRGRIVSEWEHKGEDMVAFRVCIPPNTTTVIRLPDGTETPVGAGEHRLERRVRG